MGRFFVPTAVMLVLAVVVMVASWFSFYFVAPGRATSLHIGNGEVSVFSIREGKIYESGVWAFRSWYFRLPWLPTVNKNLRAIDSIGLSRAGIATWLVGTHIAVPTWYFVVIFAVLAAIFWRPWIAARRRRRAGACASCGYDLSGGSGAVCPECGAGKVVATTAASAGGSQ